MALGILLNNGIVLGFEFSLGLKIVQIHLTFISIVFMWELEDENGESK